ncbi:hypothetical protein DSO57_1000373 [Entomophthora muscae]|uniref:Uncharacterized protein n=1 Tax=Entomophthora muscae TaxID=34485 RepID=A0ACC2TKL2_9FUNG|nr:hypothetical protein DSO57_1000373 [Entomophthora muscae]
MEPGMKPEQNPLQTASSKDWELGSPQLIDKSPFKKFNANPPGPESLTTPQGFASKLPVQEASSFPKSPVRAQIALDSQLASLELSKHAA